MTGLIKYLYSLKKKIYKNQVISGLKISNISLIYHISVMFDTILTIDNRLREKSIILIIYRDISGIYRDI